MSDAANKEIEHKIKELDTLNRIVSNGLNWLSEIDVKVAYIAPVQEFISFLQGFKGNVEQQRAALVAVQPQPVDAKLTPTELAEAK